MNASIISTRIAIIRKAEGARASFNDRVNELAKTLARNERVSIESVRNALRPAIAKLQGIEPDETGKIVFGRDAAAARTMLKEYTRGVAKAIGLEGETSKRAKPTRVPRECAEAVAKLLGQFTAEQIRAALKRAA